METKYNKRLKVKNFGYSFAFGMTLLSIILYFKNINLSYILIPLTLMIFHLFGAIFVYKMLYPTYYILTFIGKAAGNLINIIIFTIVFYIFFSPISFILRITGKDQLRYNKNINSTFNDFNNNDPKRIEKLY